MGEKLSSKRIGEIGQKAFEMWANQAGITANSSIVDERGWDVFLQLPSAPEDAAMGLWDTAPPEISCMVQVKTTTSDDQFEEITLSNWQRMVREPQPWFVAAIHLDANNQPSRAYLVHIDREWCQKVLSRLRELAKKEKKHLNEHTLNVTWTDADRLPNPHGRDLINRIRECIKPNQLAYVMEKIDWFENIGYADRAKRVSVQFKVNDRETFMDKIADVGIGVRSVLPGEWHANISDVRFGIRATLSEFGTESGDMEFRPEPLMGVLFEVFSKETARHVSVECQFFRSVSVFPFLPPEFDRSRFIYKYFECILGRLDSGTYGALFTVKLLPDSPMAVHDVQVMSEFLTMLKDNHKYPIGIGVNGKRVDNLLMSGSNENMAQIDAIEILNSGAMLCRAFRVPDTATVILNTLYAQREAANFICAAIKAETEPGKMQGPYKHMMELGKLFAVITVCVVQLEQFGLVAVSGFYGCVTNSEEREGLGCRITVDKATAINELIMVPEEEYSTLQLGPIKDNLIHRLQKLGCDTISVYEPKDAQGPDSVA